MPVAHARPRGLALAASVAFAVAASAPAAAQVPWLAPVALSGSEREVVVSSLGFDAAGRALVTWRGDRARGADAPPQRYVGTATRAPDGRWTAGDVLTGRLVVHEVVLYGRNRALLVGVREDTVGTRSRSRPLAAGQRGGRAGLGAPAPGYSGTVSTGLPTVPPLLLTPPRGGLGRCSYSTSRDLTVSPGGRESRFTRHG